MKTRRVVTVLVVFLAISFIVFAIFFWNGIIHFNNPPFGSVIGVDVSSYQGDIDWEILSSQDISFAFIKATEGSSYVDPYFENNWENAADTDLRIEHIISSVLNLPEKHKLIYFAVR